MKKLQFYRNTTIYIPTQGSTAIENAKAAISQLDEVSDGEIVLARYQENQADGTKTLVCVRHDNNNDTGWTFLEESNDGDYYTKEEIDDAEEVIAQALSELDERVTANTNALTEISASTDGLDEWKEEIEDAIDSGERVTAMALTDIDTRLVNETNERESLVQVVEDNELVTARALTELRQQIAELEEQSPIGYTETDPVFEASPAHGITSSDITNWNSKTSNVGTVTGVKMNNTTNNPTDGVVDLGTVITQETQLSVTEGGNGNAVTGITVNNHSITLQKGTFLTQHQDISGKANVADLATVATSGSYNDLTNKPTIPTVNDPTITLTFNGSTVGTFTLNQSGNQTIDIGTIIGLPSFSASNNGQVLGVVNGQLAWVTPTTIYTGSGAPSSSQGNDGDIYLQTN